MGFRIKQGDSSPLLTIDLSYSDGSLPVLAGATGRFLLRHLGPRSVPPVIDEPVALDVAAHTATWDFLTGGTPAWGDYMAEVEVTFPGGRIQTFPTQGYVPVEVVEDIG